MDELPSEAKRILALAKSAQPAPDARARQRVHEHIHGVLSAAALPRSEQASQARGKLETGKVFFNGTKIMLASVALMIGTGAAILSMRTPPALVSNPPARALPEAPAPAPQKPVGEQALTPTSPAHSAEPATKQTPVTHPAKGRSAQPQLVLAAELALLSQASDALSRGDTAKAQDALSGHQKRFRNPQLREEREGLSVLVGCVERPLAAQSRAIAFVQKHPASLLATRIRRACSLSDGS